MTINIADNDPRVSYAVAEGVTQTSFTVTFEFFDDADLNVYVDGTLKTLTTDYTVSGGSGSTGSVSISVTGASGGSTVVITRDIALERTTDFPASGAFQINALNTELDRLTAIAADLSDKADRSLQLTDYDSAVSLVLPDVNTRKGKTLAFNATTGAVEAGPSITDVQTVSAASADIATLADIEDGTDATDAIQTVAGIAANVTTVAGVSANVTTVAGQTTNMQNVTDNLVAIQNAASNATAAESAKTAAESARDSALAAYDNFDDRYLGVKASDPTLDNDGNALVAGALYFNSSTQAMKVYDGSAWYEAYANGASFLLKTNNLSDVASASTALSNLGGLATTGGSVTGNINFGDDDKAIFGAGSDLQIYHDASNSYIKDAGTGDLLVQGTQIKLQDASGNDYLRGFTGGAVYLHHAGNTKFETTSTGVTITGTAVATTDTDATNTGNITLDFGANQNFVLTLTGNVTLDNPTTEQVGQSGFIVFIQDGTGGRTVSLGTDYETAGGAVLTLSSTASATDIVPYVVAASGRILLGAPQLAFA